MNLRLRPARTTWTSRALRQPWLLDVLLCACLLAQTLGMVHRVQHGAPSSPLVARAQAAAAADHAEAAHSLHLFAGHGQVSDCQLYDHLGVAELLAGVPALAVVALRAPQAVALAWCGVVVRRTWGFQARAPPVLR